MNKMCEWRFEAGKGIVQKNHRRNKQIYLNFYAAVPFAFHLCKCFCCLFQIDMMGWWCGENKNTKIERSIISNRSGVIENRDRIPRKKEKIANTCTMNRCWWFSGIQRTRCRFKYVYKLRNCTSTKKFNLLIYVIMAKCTIDWNANDVAFKCIKIYTVRQGLDSLFPFSIAIHAKWSGDKMKSRNYSFNETSFSIFKTLTSNDDNKWVSEWSKRFSFFFIHFNRSSTIFNGLIN